MSYTTVVYQSPLIKGYKAIDNIKGEDLLIIEHIYVDNYQGCFNLIKNIPTLFGSNLPCEKTSELVDKRLYDICEIYDDDNLMMSPFTSMIKESETANIFSRPINFKFNDTEILFVITFSKKIIRQGESLSFGKPCQFQDKDIIEKNRKLFTEKIDSYLLTDKGRATTCAQNLYREGFYLVNPLCVGRGNRAQEKHPDITTTEEMLKLYQNLEFKIFNSPNDIVSKNDLVILCASHLDSECRVQFLIELLRSYQIQTKRACFHLSISYEKDVNVSRVIKFITDLAKYNYPVRIHLQKERKRQFEHYKYLSSQVEGNPWVIFSDDDDTWGEERINIVSAYIDFLKSTNTEPPIIYFPHFKSGDEYKLNLDVGNDYPREYVLLSCRLKKFKQFFQSNELLKRKYCDFIFVKYLMSSPSKGICINFENPYILYYYRNDETVNHSYHKLKVIDYLAEIKTHLGEKYQYFTVKYSLTDIYLMVIWNAIEIIYSQIVSKKRKNFDKYYHIKRRINGEFKELKETMDKGTDYNKIIDEFEELDYFKSLIDSPTWD